jgi:hypothetical protein
LVQEDSELFAFIILLSPLAEKAFEASYRFF